MIKIFVTLLARFFSATYKNKRHLQEQVLCKQEQCCSVENLQYSSVDPGTGINSRLCSVYLNA